MQVIDRLLLYDFETGHAGLLSGHREGLARHVVPWLGSGGPEVSVWIGGLASLRGAEAANDRLARARASAVYEHLVGARPGLRDPQRHALVVQSFGERYSAHTENSAFYRSVLVVVSRSPMPRSVESSPSLRAHPFHRFRIRQKGLSFDGGSYYVAGSFGFEIDYDTSAPGCPASEPMIYRLRGYAGVGQGAPVGANYADPDGPWNTFASPMVTTTRGFAGWASIGGWAIQLGVTIGSETKLALYPSAGETSVQLDPFVSRSYGFAASFGVIGGPFEYCGPS